MPPGAKPVNPDSSWLPPGATPVGSVSDLGNLDAMMPPAYSDRGRNKLASFLPTAAAMGVAAIPGVGPLEALGLTGLAGFGGKMAQNALQNPPPGPHEGYGGMFLTHSDTNRKPLAEGAGLEAGSQMAATLGGHLATAGLAAAAKPIARVGLGVTETLAKRFPNLDIPQEFLNRRIGTSAAASEAKSGFANELSTTLGNAEGAGWKASAADLAQPGIDRIEKEVIKRPMTNQERNAYIAQVRDHANSILTAHAGGENVVNYNNTTFTPSEIQMVKKTSQYRNSARYNAQGQGFKNVSADPTLNADVAVGAQRALESIPTTFGRDVGSTNADYQTSKALNLALRHAEHFEIPQWMALRFPMYAGGAVAGMVTHNPTVAALDALGAGVTEFAANRGLQRGTALALTHPATPRVMDALSRIFLFGGEQVLQNRSTAPPAQGGQ